MRYFDIRRDRLRRRNVRRWSRHPWDRGDPYQLEAAAAFRCLLDSKFWRRHYEPFAKTEAGRERRAERRFVRAQQHSIDTDKTRDGRDETA